VSEKQLDVNDTLFVKSPDGEELEFSVVALLEDEDDGSSYAVLVHEPGDDEEEESFIVTDPYGNLLENDALAQEVLDDYLLFTDENSENGAE
jgi:uncharacterized protein YrzB (UPF0473 family)